MDIQWYSGLNNYKKHTLTFGDENTFVTELLDVELEPANTIEEVFSIHLANAKFPIEVLYSGGLDSEFVISVCKKLKIPVIALTLRMMLFGAPFNTHDLYYAEKFCRENDVQHRIIDLDIEKFFMSGDHLKYTDPYKMTAVASPTIMWLIDQCHSYPVYGGDYTWPLLNCNLSAYSPHRHNFNCYDHFMDIRGGGIGNMLSHSLDSNMILIKEHVAAYKDTTFFKSEIFKSLGYNLETRHRSHGWENVFEFKNKFDINQVTKDLHDRYGLCKSIVRWGNSLGSLIDAEPGEYFDYGRILG